MEYQRRWRKSLPVERIEDRREKDRIKYWKKTPEEREDLLAKKRERMNKLYDSMTSEQKDEYLRHHSELKELRVIENYFPSLVENEITEFRRIYLQLLFKNTDKAKEIRRMMEQQEGTEFVQSVLGEIDYLLPDGYSFRHLPSQVKAREYHREYYKRPDIKERKREYYKRPDIKERRKEYYKRRVVLNEKQNAKY
jgi:hypothetical protein